MNNPFDYLPDSACDEAFRELVVRLEELKGSIKEEDTSFCRALESGVMLGVLIADDPDGVRHTLYAFSGQIGDGGFHYPGFVEPVFDYLQPEGYFKRKEADISKQNREIEQFKHNILAKSKGDYEDFKVRLDAEISEYKDKCRLSKQERDAKRESGSAGESEMAAMIRQSQFEKAELHRLKKRAKESLQPLEDAVKRAESRMALMKEKRRKDSEDLQRWLFSNFRVLNARGESKSLIDIFAATPMKMPPSGAGECCAPKLLQAAYVRGWHHVVI
ncbi:MAG: RluA family pseudouridine synthase, partial [Muribaculaceae bacterium]|nr:RluA family pseudouridine synthase [Muribaculaceae bacterium]